MKILFLKVEELAETLTKIEAQNGKVVTDCRIAYSEELECDTIVWVENEKVEELPLYERLPELSNFYQETITKYDVCEFGDFGEGFAFFV